MLILTPQIITFLFKMSLSDRVEVKLVLKFTITFLRIIIITRNLISITFSEEQNFLGFQIGWTTGSR
jgi:hypothetical protein